MLCKAMPADVDDVVNHTLPFLNEIDSQALAEATLSPNPQPYMRPHFLVHETGVYRYKNCRYTHISHFWRDLHQYLLIQSLFCAWGQEFFQRDGRGLFPDPIDYHQLSACFEWMSLQTLFYWLEQSGRQIHRSPLQFKVSSSTPPRKPMLKVRWSASALNHCDLITLPATAVLRMWQSSKACFRNGKKFTTLVQGKSPECVSSPCPTRKAYLLFWDLHNHLSWQSRNLCLIKMYASNCGITAIRIPIKYKAEWYSWFGRDIISLFTNQSDHYSLCLYHCKLFHGLHFHQSTGTLHGHCRKQWARKSRIRSKV